SKYKNAVVIEDLTHDILSYKDCKVDYCFASLRKQLPLPCGGFCYSPTKQELPEAEYNLNGEKVAFQKTTAMFLKREYLEERFKYKEIWRNQFLEAESDFGKKFINGRMPEIAESVLAWLNIDRILEK